MRFMIGYTVWNKQDMICWLLEGVSQFFGPENTEVAFHFDACTDDSVNVYNYVMPHYLINMRGWNAAHVHSLVSHTEVRELGGHNRLIDLFMSSACDFLIVAQDDHRFIKDVRPGLEFLALEYGDRLGVVGGRDGFAANYNNFAGSEWSESKVQRRLKHGEFVERPYINSGPVVYNKKLVQVVGKLDEEFYAYYVWDDYGARAREAGFVSGVMGMDLIHRKFGRVQATTAEFIDASARDLARLRQKHPIL